MPTDTCSTPIIRYHHICNTCGKVFQRKTGLERHRKSVHSNENPYECEYCIKKFSRTDLLQRHVSLYHNQLASQILLQSATRKDLSINIPFKTDSLILTNNETTGIPLNIKWPSPEQRHIQLFQIHFSQHISFIHPSFFEVKNQREDDELDSDLRRGMAIIGGIYERALQGGLDKGGRPLERSCIYYGQEELKRKILSSIENLQEDIQNHSKRFLVRRTQLMILLQLAAMFSDNRKHFISAKLTHGSLIAIARELLNETNKNLNTFSKQMSWMEFIEQEECIRTIWTVYLVDSQHSFCNQQKPWFNLSEFSNLPDRSNNEIWNVKSKNEFDNLRQQISSSPKPVYILDLVNRLKSKKSFTPSKQLSPTGMFTILLCIVTEISGLVRDDFMIRKGLANRVQRVDKEEIESILQEINSYDKALKQSLDRINQYLTRWLSITSSSSNSNIDLKCKKITFMLDIMPWYWAGVHFIHLLYNRILQRTDENIDIATFLQSNISSGQLIQAQIDPLEIMHFLVRIRLAMQDPDYEIALMQKSIRNDNFKNNLPPLPMSVAISSITGLFPLQST